MDQKQTSREQLFDSIIAEERDRLGRIARVYALHEQEDLIQEMLMQIWRSLPQFSGQSKLSTWAYRIGINTAISWRRNATRLKRQPPANRIDAEQVAGEAQPSDTVRLLERFLSTQSEIDRAVLLMYLEDLNYEEIADVVGVSAGAIRTRMSRIRSRLQSWESGSD